MRKILIFVIISLCNFNGEIIGQTMNCLWAKSAHGSHYNNSTWGNSGTSISTDLSGNVFMAGTFNTPSIIFGNYTLTNASNIGNISDIFIVKYSPTGNVLWATSIGGTRYDQDPFISTDASGNIFVTGSFQSSSMTVGTTTLINSSNTGNDNDVFIIKYSSIGALVWAFSAMGNGGYSDNGTGVSVDASGNAILTGFFGSATISFGPTTLTNTSNLGFTDDIFVVKYSPNGNVLWANSMSGAKNDRSTGVSTDASGNVFICGQYYSPTLAFGTTTITCGSQANTTDGFIAKYSPTGAILWAKSISGSVDEVPKSVASDGNGDVLLTGYFTSPAINFGPTYLVNNNINADGFIAKYSSSGTFLWANSINGTSDDKAISVSTDLNGNVIITGIFKSTFITIGNLNLNSISGASTFIAKYASDGSLLWVNSILGSSCGTGVATDQSGKVFISGLFWSGYIDFVSRTLINSVNDGATNDYFIAKLGDAIVGLNEMQIQEDIISVFPNPFTEQTTLSFSPNKHFKFIRIIDIMGNEVNAVYMTNSGNITIEKGTNKNGVYFIQLIDENSRTWNKKIVIQ